MTQDIDHIINHLSLKTRMRRWRFIAIALIVMAGIGLVAYFAGNGVPAQDHIARVHIDGMITGDDAQLQLIRDLSDEAQVKGMVLRINSPGGTTAGSEALYEELRAFAAKKPMVAVMDTVAASGGYIAGIASDHIVARGNTITGSIGVIFSYPEFSVLLNTLGIRMEELKSGELKAEPSPYKPASEKSKAVSMEMIQDGFEWFKGLVSARRKLSPERTAVLADGRVYTGRQALKEGLIDEIGGEDQGRAWLVEQLRTAGVSNPDSLKLVTRKAPREDGYGLPLGKAALRALGLQGLAESAERSKLDGLLVLWHPAF